MRVEIFRHQSRLLAGNPLGDPVERDLGVVLPDGYDESARRYPTIMVLTGFTGTGLAMLNKTPWQPSLDQRYARLLADGRALPAVLILPDCFTRYGGSQYVDSPAIGRYQSYLVEEVLPAVEARYRVIAAPEGRGVVGKSSGGYGALTMVLDRPGIFGAVGSHAGDAAFELSYRRELPATLVALERRGGVEGYLRWFETLTQKPGSAIEVMSNLCCAAAWSPNASGPYGFGKGFALPFDPFSGALVPQVWARWLARDPVLRLGETRALEALRPLGAIFIDAGLSDEYFLQLGARQLSARLHAAKIAHVHEEFDGGHMGTQHRYDRSLEVLTRALATS